MTEPLNHPTAERLQAFVEESLEEADGAVVRSHLASCPECEAEVVELQALFAALSALPELEPTPGFADRVMKHVRVRNPLVAATIAWVDRMAPQTTRGWAAAAAMLALPVLGTTVLAGWLLAQPGVNAQGLWTFLTVLVGDAAAATGQWAMAQLAGSSLSVWADRALEFLASVGRGQIGLALVMFATLTAGSIYVLYQNLFRTQQQRRIEHASYVL